MDLTLIFYIFVFIVFSRRLITLNKCASMKLDVNLPRKKVRVNSLLFSAATQNTNNILTRDNKVFNQMYRSSTGNTGVFVFWSMLHIVLNYFKIR